MVLTPKVSHQACLNSNWGMQAFWEGRLNHGSLELKLGREFVLAWCHHRLPFPCESRLDWSCWVDYRCAQHYDQGFPWQGSSHYLLPVRPASKTCLCWADFLFLPVFSSYLPPLGSFCACPCFCGHFAAWNWFLATLDPPAKQQILKRGFKKGCLQYYKKREKMLEWCKSSVM